MTSSTHIIMVSMHCEKLKDVFPLSRDETIQQVKDSKMYLEECEGETLTLLEEEVDKVLNMDFQKSNNGSYVIILTNIRHTGDEFGIQVDDFIPCDVSDYVAEELMRNSKSNKIVGVMSMEGDGE